MATNQMEEGLLLKERDEVLAAIIERYPNNDIFIKGDGVSLRVFISEGSSGVLMFDGKMFGTDWTDLMRNIEVRSRYSRPLPDYGCHWIDKTYRRNWFLYSI